MSLADAQAEGARVDVVYSVAQAVELARQSPEPIVFFATGFETTAVATAAAVLADPPSNFFVLSAHKYIPPVMEIVAEMPNTRVEGILAGLVKLVELIRDRAVSVENMYPRCVTKEGNLRAQEQLWRVFRPIGGRWRGIAHVPNGNLRLRDEYAQLDARKQFEVDVTGLWDYAPPALVHECICGDIMAGIKSPTDCALFGKECVPHSPVGACMVSSEGTCKIWHQYGGHPDLSSHSGGYGAVCTR
jgi:hydrogenase expression/formation protein HypD